MEKRVYKVDKKYWRWELRDLGGQRHRSGEACSRADAEEQIADKIAQWHRDDRQNALRQATLWVQV